MTPSQVLKFLDFELYQFGEIVFRNGRKTPYTVRLPELPHCKLFQFFAKLVWNCGSFDKFDMIHCIGIANSGIPLARAVYEQGNELGKSVFFSTVCPHTKQHIIGSDSKKATSVLFDNAVTTGNTLSEILPITQQLGFYPKVVLRIFDREDIGTDGLRTVDRIKNRFGLNLISIIRLRDIIQYLNNDEYQSIIKYQSAYGTLSFKKWIGRRL